MSVKSSIQSKYKKLITYIIVIFAVLSSVFFFIYAYITIDEKYRAQSLSVIDLTKNTLEITFENTQRSLISLKNYLVLPQNIDNDIYYNETLTTFKNVFRDASTIFIGDATGRFYLFPKRYVAPDYDPRLRPWYINATEVKSKVNWTDPYVDHGTGEFTITASKYVGDGMVIGVDILLNNITTLVEKTTIGAHGQLFIVNASGKILASKNKDYLAGDWDALRISQTTFEKMKTSNDINDGNLHLFVEEIPSMGMYVVVVIKHIEIINTLILMFLILFVTTTVLIYISGKYLVKVSDRIVQPIYQLAQTMSLYSDIDEYKPCELTTDDYEVETLINGFNSMITSISDKNFEMQALYEELFASEETLQDQYDQLLQNNEYIQNSEQRYKSIFEASEEGLWDLEPNGSIQYLTPAWYSIFDIDVNHSSLDQWLKLIHPDDRAKVETELNGYQLGLVNNYRLEYRVLSKSGEYIWIEAVGIARYVDDVFVSMTGSHQNITKRKEYELNIHDMAYKDPLTKLYNRRYFEERFEEVLMANGKGVLLLMDIDNFKYINDIYGHSFGDEILKKFAKRLIEVYGQNENAYFARFRGNEFAILVKHIADRSETLKILDTLIKTIEIPISAQSKIVKVTASIGVTLFPMDGENVEQLIQNADIAMYHARKVTKKSFHFFDQEIKQNAINEMLLENHMRSAIDNNEFEVYYQPIISLEPGKISGFEALIRWNSKVLGLVMPDKFIPLAENTGLIIDIGYFVLEKACEKIAKLNRDNDQKYSISINISVIQLLEEQFVSKVLEIISNFDIPKHLIRLEITESIMLETNENIIAKLFYLRSQHIGISLDDFGTGYSSFKNLIRLPLNGIKIDKALMKDSSTNENVFQLIDSIVDFAHKTGIDVVAEGIENKLLVEKSKELHVDYVQGYHYSKPIKGDLLEEAIIKLNEAL